METNKNEECKLRMELEDAVLNAPLRVPASQKKTQKSKINVEEALRQHKAWCPICKEQAKQAAEKSND